MQITTIGLDIATASDGGSSFLNISLTSPGTGFDSAVFNFQTLNNGKWDGQHLRHPAADCGYDEQIACNAGDDQASLVGPAEAPATGTFGSL
jgi:primase-polymerase (primpol)-like protein